MSPMKIALIVGLIVILLVGCGGVLPKQRDAVDKALRSLNKINKETKEIKRREDLKGQVHHQLSELQKYNSLVAGEKPYVNEALDVLPDGELKKKLSAAMDAYSDAGDVWGEKLRSYTVVRKDDEVFGRIIEKYSLQTKPGYKRFGDSIEDKEKAVYAIWQYGEEYLIQAASLHR